MFMCLCVPFFFFFFSFAQDWENRQEEDNLLIERILLLVRNILHVPADLEQEKVRVWGLLSSCAV